MQLVILELFLLFSVVHSLPEGWTVCRKNSSGYDKCIQDAANFAIQNLVSGNEQYGLPPIDPLDALDYSVTSPNGPVSLSASFKNTEVIGFKNSRIKNMMTDWKTMNFTLVADSVSLECDCTVNGRLLTLPLVGSGKIEGSFVRPTFLFFMKLSEKQIEGKLHYHVDECSFELKDAKAMTFNTGNLFNTNKDFGDKMNKVINDNLGILINELRVPLQDGIGRNGKTYANMVFAKFPKDEITPP